MKAAFHVARTGRCGPVLVDIARDVQEAELDFAYPDESTSPAGSRRSSVHPRQIAARRARRSPPPRSPSSTSAAATLNADACAELLELAEVGRLPVVTTLMAQGRVPRDARAPLRLARHARLEVVELGA